MQSVYDSFDRNIQMSSLLEVIAGFQQWFLCTHKRADTSPPALTLSSSVCVVSPPHFEAVMGGTAHFLLMDVEELVYQCNLSGQQVPCIYFM